MRSDAKAGAVDVTAPQGGGANLSSTTLGHQLAAGDEVHVASLLTGAAMALSSVLVVSVSLRLRRFEAAS